ncbi:heavy-metal-associated domain-containing protein [Agromyces albus]|uniref:Heavy-metal-associated domain-containing protein n=1 Tax=Agromyces albus TaxID=205332 RepID=A0A4Q2KSV0_9MICO|nr:heavy metal-associated domain-containing protein [Agromyces albus]RXZ67859.1 heavy-metal-associated domain-containing protein [Agromyces albus]
MTLIPEGRTELTLATDACSCCATDSQGVSIEVRTDAAASAYRAEFGVTGMTCSNCVRHVTEELTALDGVDGVDVALNVGGVSTVTLQSSVPLDDAAVTAAVAEAGYEVVAG